MKVIPDESTRLAALKRGEIDIAYSVRAELAEELQRTPGLTLRPTVGSAPYYMYFPEQWDPKSPWHDRRVRLATKYALDYNTINQALTLGHSHITGSVIPENFEFYTQARAAGVRSGQGEAAACRGRPSRRVRCRLLYLRRGVCEPRRGGAQLPRGGRHSRQAAAAGAGGVLQGLRRQEVQEHHPGRQRRVRQCRDAAAGIRGQGRRLCLRQLSRDRRAVPAAGGRAGPHEARGNPGEDAATAR